MSVPSQPAAQPTPSARSDWTYVSGVGGYSVLDTVLQLWLIYFFVPPPERGSPLVDAQTFGLAVWVGRSVEALAHPAAGFVSDRWGKPWRLMLAGALAFGLGSTALFWLPEAGQTLQNRRLLFALLPLALIGQATYAVPYLGLLPKLALDPQRRLELSNAQALIILVGVLVGQVGSGVALNALGNNLPLTVTIFFGAAMLLLWLPWLTIRNLATDGADQPFSPRELLAIVQRNPGFRSIVVAQGLFWWGFNLVRSVVIYEVTVLLGRPEAEVAFYLGGIFLVTLPSLAVTRVLVSRLGKRRLMLVATGLFAVLFPLLSTIGMSVGPLSAPVWAWLLLASSGFPLAILSAIPNAMVADEVDRDAQATGQNKAALFFGMQGLIVKLSAGLAGALLGYLLAQFGYSQVQPLGIQLVGPISGLLMLGALFAYSTYPQSGDAGSAASPKT